MTILVEAVPRWLLPSVDRGALQTDLEASYARYRPLCTRREFRA